MTEKIELPKDHTEDHQKFKLDSIVAQLKLDLPNIDESEREKYVDLMAIMLDDYMVEDLQVNGGENNFSLFITKYGIELLKWKETR